VLTTFQVNIWREIQQAGAGIIHADTQAGANQLLADWLALPRDAQDTMRTQAQACFQQHFEIQTVTQNLLAALQDAATPTTPPAAHTFTGSFFKRTSAVHT